jgi:argininosuccinate synthase
VREEFVRDFVFPMFRANAVYEGVYLLGTSIARPLISKRLVEIAARPAPTHRHGATGKGNDQVRFELSAYALNPDIKVIAPWRDWTFKSRTDLIEFAEKHQIPVAKDKRGEAPFSVDANLLHSSSEGKVLEDPASGSPEYVHHAHGLAGWTHPTRPPIIEIGFENGDAVSINGEAMSPATLLAEAQRSRPRQRHRPARPGREPLCRHEVARRLRDARRHHPARRPPGDGIDHARPRRCPSQGRADAALRGADLQRLLVLARARDAAGAIDQSQKHVEGEVTLKLYKGNVMVTGRRATSRSIPTRWSPSRTIAVPMTRRMRKASSV